MMITTKIEARSAVASDEIGLEADVDEVSTDEVEVALAVVLPPVVLEVPDVLQKAEYDGGGPATPSSFIAPK